MFSDVQTQQHTGSVWDAVNVWPHSVAKGFHKWLRELSSSRVASLPQGPTGWLRLPPRQEAGYAKASRAGFPLSFVCLRLLSCPLLDTLPQNISRWRRRRCAIAGHFYWAHCVVCTSHNHLAVGVLVAFTKLPYCTNGSIVHTQSLCFCALYWVHVCRKPFIMEKHTTLHKDLDSAVVLSFSVSFFLCWC